MGEGACDGVSCPPAGLPGALGAGALGEGMAELGDAATDDGTGGEPAGLPDAGGAGPLGEGGAGLEGAATEEETGWEVGPAEELEDVTTADGEGGAGELEVAEPTEELNDKATDEAGPPAAGGTGFPTIAGESPVYA